MNPHIILGVQQDVDNEHLRKRYKKVCKMFHPDKHNNDPSAVALFQVVVDAYESIKASRKRITVEDVEIENPTPKKEDVIIPGTNITQNDVKILGDYLKDPWFDPGFSLVEMFKDVDIPSRKTS